MAISETVASVTAACGEGLPPRGGGDRGSGMVASGASAGSTVSAGVNAGQIRVRAFASETSESRVVD